MTKSKIVEKNLALSGELEDYLFKNPSHLSELPKDSNIVVLNKQDKELTQANESMITDLKNKGEKVVVAEKLGKNEWRIDFK